MSSPYLDPREPVCPPDLLAYATRAPTPRVAIARAGAPIPMQAAQAAVAADIMVPVFVGERDDIRREADALGWDISGYDLHHTEGEQAAGERAADLCGAGEADVLQKGQLHSDVFIKAALRREAGLRTDHRFQHIFHVSPPDGGPALWITDAAVNIAPDLDTQKRNLAALVDVMHRFGIARPRVAILSATESVLPGIASSVMAADLASWARDAVPGADVDGPLALDLILSEAAVAIKGLTGRPPVAGHADAVVVPDLVSGNLLFKALVYIGGGCAAGIVVGAKVPILLTSRADPPAARLASVALAAILDPSWDG